MKVPKILKQDKMKWLKSKGKKPDNKEKVVCCAIEKQLKLRILQLWKTCGKHINESLRPLERIKRKNKKIATTTRIFHVV